MKIEIGDPAENEVLDAENEGLAAQRLALMAGDDPEGNAVPPPTTVNITDAELEAWEWAASQNPKPFKTGRTWQWYDKHGKPLYESTQEILTRIRKRKTEDAAERAKRLIAGGADEPLDRPME